MKNNPKLLITKIINNLYLLFWDQYNHNAKLNYSVITQIDHQTVNLFTLLV